MSLIVDSLCIPNLQSHQPRRFSIEISSNQINYYQYVSIVMLFFRLIIFRVKKTKANTTQIPPTMKYIIAKKKFLPPKLLVCDNTKYFEPFMFDTLYAILISLYCC
jgi:hypothetical protein